MRGHDDIGGGTRIGSNLFNGLAIVGTAASIHPIRAPFAEVAVSPGFGVLALFMLVPGTSGVIPRRRGYWRLAGYVAFVALTLGVGAAGGA